MVNKKLNNMLNNLTNVENNSNNENKNTKKVTKSKKKTIKSNNSNKSELNNSKINSKNVIIRPFNRELSKQIKNINSLNKNNKDKTYKEEIEIYQNSFDDIINFSKKITAIKKKVLIVLFIIQVIVMVLCQQILL